MTKIHLKLFWTNDESPSEKFICGIKGIKGINYGKP